MLVFTLTGHEWTGDPNTFEHWENIPGFLRHYTVATGNKSSGNILLIDKHYCWDRRTMSWVISPSDIRPGERFYVGPRHLDQSRVVFRDDVLSLTALLLDMGYLKRV